MKKYILSKEEKGFIISSLPVHSCEVGQRWAFSTLDQALKFFPTLMAEPIGKKTKIK